MTSKNSFFLNIKENLKRRGAVLAAFAIYFFFAFPVACALKINNYIYQPSTPHADNYEHLYSDLIELLGINSATCFFVIVMAALCGFQAFSWLHHRPRVDMYHALPVSKNRRFAVIYLNGILSFALTYLGALLLSLLVYTLMWKAPDGAMLANIAISYGVHMLLYLCAYHLSILSVMLTGNTVITCFAFLILLFYEAIVYLLYYGYAATFFKTYWNPNDTSPGLFSPLIQYFFFTEQARLPLPYSLQPIFMMLGYAILTLILAWLLYRLHPSDGCGKAVVFPKLRPFLKFFLLLPFALSSAAIFYDLTGSSLPFAIFGLMIGLLMGHCILEIIFDFDLRSALHHKKSLLVCSLSCILIFSAYAFDLFGYDSYVPSEKQLVSAAWLPDLDSSFVYSLSTSIAQNDKPYETMQITDKDTILALTELAMPEPSDGEETLIRFRIAYHLRGGRSVYRELYVDFTEAEALLNKLYLSEEYKHASLPLYQEQLMNSIYSSNPALCYTNNVMNYQDRFTSREVMDELFAAYCKDYETLSFTQAYTTMPCGYLDFSSNAPDYYAPSGFRGYRYYSAGEFRLPVYPSFSNTLEILQKHGVSPWREFNAAQISHITVNGSYEIAGSEDNSWQSVRVTISDPQQIQQLSAIVLPMPEYFHGYATDIYNNFTITAYYTQQDAAKQATFYFPDFESVPDFVFAAKEQADG